MDEMRIRYELKTHNAEREHVASRGQVQRAVERFCSEMVVGLEDLGCSTGVRREEFERMIS